MQMSGVKAAALCPSSQPDMDGAFAFGVVGGEGGRTRVRWIEKPVPATAELLAMTEPAPPTQVLRFASPCQDNACTHFDGKDCGLASRIVKMLDPVTGALPPCSFRADCRWFRQEGAAACRRCPQIVTETAAPSEQLRQAATPAARTVNVTV